MNPLFVGIDVSSKNNVTYLMKPEAFRSSEPHCNIIKYFHIDISPFYE